jgi:hypothetical protein
VPRRSLAEHAPRRSRRAAQVEESRRLREVPHRRLIQSLSSHIAEGKPSDAFDDLVGHKTPDGHACGRVSRRAHPLMIRAAWREGHCDPRSDRAAGGRRHRQRKNRGWVQNRVRVRWIISGFGSRVLVVLRLRRVLSAHRLWDAVSSNATIRGPRCGCAASRLFLSRRRSLLEMRRVDRVGQERPPTAYVRSARDPSGGEGLHGQAAARSAEGAATGGPSGHAAYAWQGHRIRAIGRE